MGVLSRLDDELGTLTFAWHFGHGMTEIVYRRSLDALSTVSAIKSHDGFIQAGLSHNEFREEFTRYRHILAVRNS